MNRRLSGRWNRFQPSFEVLENRLVLAVAVTLLDTDGNGVLDTFQIVGDGSNQSLSVRDFGDHIEVDLDSNGNGNFTDPGDRNNDVTDGVFTRFDLQMQGGDDSVTFAQEVAYQNVSKKVLVKLGSGSNRFHSERVDAGSLTDATLKFKISEGLGNDSINIEHGGNLTRSSLKVLADMGVGDDTVSFFKAGSIGDTSLVDTDFLLGAGNNTLDLEISSSLFLGTNSVIDVDILGGGAANEAEFITAAMNGNLQSATSRMFLDALLGGGNDTMAITHNEAFDINFAGAELRANVKGEDGNDNVTVTSLDVANAVARNVNGLYDLRLDGGNGNDGVRANLDNGDGFEIDGTLLTRLKGGAGLDQVELNVKADPASTGTVDAKLQGLADNDNLDLTFNNLAGANLNFGPLGLILLDGGTGTDDADILLTGIVQVGKVNCET